LKGVAFIAVFIAALTPFAVIVLLVYGSAQGVIVWSPPLLWTSQFGSSNLTSGVIGTASSNDGVYVVGVVNYTVGANHLVSFVPIVRQYRADGSIAWTSTVGNIPRFYPTGIALGSDGVYGLGGASNASIVKSDLDGRPLWSLTMNRGIVLSAISASANGVYVAGSSDHPLTNQSFTGTNIMFLRRYDPNGSLVWTEEFSSSSDYVSGIYAGSSGVFVLTTLYVVGYSLGGRELWLHQVGIPLLMNPLSISADTSGVYFADSIGECPLCPHTSFLSKYDLTGNVVWNVTFESPDRSEPLGALLTADSSGVYLSSSAGRYGFIEKYDQNGDSLWTMKTPLSQRGDSPDWTIF